MVVGQLFIRPDHADHAVDRRVALRGAQQTFCRRLGDVTDDGHLWARIRLIPAAIAVVVLIMLWVLFREQDAVPTGGAEPVEVDRSGSGV